MYSSPQEMYAPPPAEVELEEDEEEEEEEEEELEEYEEEEEDYDEEPPEPPIPATRGLGGPLQVDGNEYGFSAAGGGDPRIDALIETVNQMGSQLAMLQATTNQHAQALSAMGAPTQGLAPAAAPPALPGGYGMYDPSTPNGPATANGPATFAAPGPKGKGSAPGSATVKRQPKAKAFCGCL
jgi:hypothetical protein